MNTPYIKKYDSNGNVINPLVENYMSTFPNRRERHIKLGRFHNNKTGIHLTITKTDKYKRFMQVITIGSDIKIINHYILCK